MKKIYSIRYYVLIKKLKENDYSVFYPDFKECHAYGHTFWDARENAKITLKEHIYSMMENKEPIPKPTCIRDIYDLEQSMHAIPVLIDEEIIINSDNE